eukprot:CAMPEP_0119326916 /NCGR_PEP_ID=MMETSP1333-20130426/69583_1 /TAXON_ID=418940 /ORGANISM="Scyphosphaera apsteinii, Strain RCC1455" /LENGTH=149 /DNA_ID=CAMNT_0007335355 /DNA_START=273 /DNA_END=718 /DNA_ORIENTATION=-
MRSPDVSDPGVRPDPQLAQLREKGIALTQRAIRQRSIVEFEPRPAAVHEGMALDVVLVEELIDTASGLQRRSESASGWKERIDSREGMGAVLRTRSVAIAANQVCSEPRREQQLHHKAKRWPHQVEERLLEERLLNLWVVDVYLNNHEV